MSLGDTEDLCSTWTDHKIDGLAASSHMAGPPGKIYDGQDEDYAPNAVIALENGYRYIFSPSVISLSRNYLKEASQCT